MNHYDYDSTDYNPADDYDEADLLDNDGEIEECGACGKPATHYDHNEPVCSRHRAKDVYGV